MAVNNFPPDGLLGMGFKFISSYGENSVFENLVEQGQTDAPVFSFKLASSGSSELFLGGANDALYTGSFTYTPVTNAVSCELGVYWTSSDICCAGFLGSQHG